MTSIDESRSNTNTPGTGCLPDMDSSATPSLSTTLPTLTRDDTVTPGSVLYGMEEEEQSSDRNYLETWRYICNTEGTYTA
eukprot:UN03862